MENEEHRNYEQTKRFNDALSVYMAQNKEALDRIERTQEKGEAKVAAGMDKLESKIELGIKELEGKLDNGIGARLTLVEREMLLLKTKVAFIAGGIALVVALAKDYFLHSLGK